MIIAILHANTIASPVFLRWAWYRTKNTTQTRLNLKLCEFPQMVELHDETNWKWNSPLPMMQHRHYTQNTNRMQSVMQLRKCKDYVYGQRNNKATDRNNWAVKYGLLTHYSR